MLYLLQEVVEVKLVFGNLLLQAAGLLLVILFLGALHEGNDVAHAQDAVGHAFGVEHVEGVHLLARADELDGFVHHGAYAQGRTAAGVAVELCQHDAAEVEPLVKFLRRVHSVLTRHRVHHEERFVGVERFFQVGYLVHHLLVHGQASGGVDDDQIVFLLLGFA